MGEPRELDDATHQQIVAICRDADELAENGRYREALVTYNAAWGLVPEPKTDWTAATWLLAAIGDAAFLGGFSDIARDALDDAMDCPGAIGNPFLHLRRGQVLLDAGELDQAADELIRAYMGGGEELFEDEDGRYFDFLKTRAKL